MGGRRETLGTKQVRAGAPGEGGSCSVIDLFSTWRFVAPFQSM